MNEAEREQMLSMIADKLQSYYEDEIVGTMVDLVHDQNGGTACDDGDEYY